jgi:hypothetical protein
MRLFSSKQYGFKREIPRGKGEPYLTRYYILESTLLDVYIHKFNASDYPVPHDHPASFISMPITVGYIEHFPDGTSIIRKPFRPKFRTSREFHWVEKIPNMLSPWTLFLFFKRIRNWGFLTKDGWVDHETYIREVLGK